MSKDPINLESMSSGTPETSGREIDNPDNNPVDRIIPMQGTPPVKKDPEEISEEMSARLKFIPKELQDRVKALTRSELVGAGIPVDREAYSAYIYAEKMIRDEQRRNARIELKKAGAPGTYDA